MSESLFRLLRYILLEPFLVKNSDEEQNSLCGYPKQFKRLHVLDTNIKNVASKLGVTLTEF